MVPKGSDDLQEVPRLGLAKTMAINDGGMPWHTDVSGMVHRTRVPSACINRISWRLTWQTSQYSEDEVSDNKSSQPQQTRRTASYFSFRTAVPQL